MKDLDGKLENARNAPRAFWCFISYRHDDNRVSGRQWATWLHQAIETYEVPPDLIGRVNDRGDVIPERIFPVFRDEEELPVDADLATPIYRALDNSKFLVVICSPVAVESTYVAAEIRYFKKLGRGDRVLAVMIAGEPNARWDVGKQERGFSPNDECFPEPLRHSVDAEGNLLPDHTEPIAADFRLPENGQEGWTSPEAFRQALLADDGNNRPTIEKKVASYRARSDLMKLKIVAGILGVPLGTLTARDKAYQLRIAKRRQRIIAVVAAALCLLLALAIAAGIYAWRKRTAAVAATDLAEARLKSSARTDWVTAKDLIAAGRTKEAFAYLARACENDPSWSIPAETSILALNGWAEAIAPLKRLEGHSGAVRSIEFNHDAALVVTASDDRTVRLWDTQSARQLASVRVDDKPAQSAHFNVDGTLFVTSSDGDAATVWESPTGKPIASLRVHSGGISEGVFDPSGSKIATRGGDGTVRIWEARTGKQLLILEGHNNPPSSVAFDQTGKRIVSTSGQRHDRAIVWDAVTGSELLRLEEHSYSPHSALFDRDGTRVMTVSVDQTAIVWDAKTGQPEGTLPHPARLVSAEFSPDGEYILTVSAENIARVWGNPQEHSILEGHLGLVTCGHFSPDGSRVVTASADGTAKLYEARTGKLLQTFEASQQVVRDVSYSGNGRLLATAANDGVALIWDAVPALLASTFNGHTESLRTCQYDSTGSKLFTAAVDGTMCLWDSVTGRLLQTFRAPAEQISAAALSPASDLVAVGSDASVLVLRTGDAFVLATLRGHNDIVRSVTFSPNGKWMATASADKTVRLWDRTGKEIQLLSGHSAGISQVAFSPDATRVVTASDDHTGRVWEIPSGRLVAVLRGHEELVLTANFTNDGFRIITSSVDRTVRTWDAVTGNLLTSVQGDDRWQLGAQPNREGTRVLTATGGGSVSLWSAQDGRHIGILKTGKPAVTVTAFSPTGEQIVVGFEDGTAISAQVAPAGKAHPEWWANFLRAIADRTFADTGQIAKVSPPHLQTLRNNAIEHARADSSGFGTLASWLFTPNEKRSVHPRSALNARGFADTLITAEAPKGDLLRAFELDPSHPLIQLALSRFEKYDSRAEFMRNTSIKAIRSGPQYIPRGSALLAALAAAEWEREESDLAIRTYKILAELDTSRDWSAASTISEQPWSNGLKQQVEAVRAATASPAH